MEERNRKTLTVDAAGNDRKPPIFIGGAGRSGTSLLRCILNAHDNISIGGEFKITPVIADFWNKINGYKRHLKNKFFVEPEHVDKAFRDLILSLLSCYHKQCGSRRIGEKTPNNVFYFQHLNRIFPGSPLLHMVRDGRDVVHSLLNRDWHDAQGNPLAITRNVRDAALYWKNAVLSGMKAGRRPSVAAQYCEIRYEDLVRHPKQTVQRILHHIEEPWQDDLLHFHKLDDAYFKSTQRPISDESVGKWRGALNSEQKDIIKETAGDLLMKLKYASDYSW